MIGLVGLVGLVGMFCPVLGLPLPVVPLGLLVTPPEPGTISTIPPLPLLPLLPLELLPEEIRSPHLVQTPPT